MMPQRTSLNPGWFGLALVLPLLLLLGAWHWMLLPGLSWTLQVQQERSQLEANVYEAGWLDSAQNQLKRDLRVSQQNLVYAKSRLLPNRPFQQTLDSLREHAGISGIEILETQVATSRQDSLRTMLLKVHARGPYPSYWKWLKQLESQQPWWSIQEMVLKPVGETNAVLDGSMVFAATGHEEVLP